ncbi:MAG TPA: hypothetical protein VFY60_18355, partial [Pyrinomonadaceae bacterium]|nr:hypothetical protein [Pyrinomonadaceae bacterium]
AAGETTTKWTNITAHPTKPLVLVSDSSGVSTQCRYPSTPAGQQLIPHWTTAPWLNSLSSVHEGSPIDLALTKPWDAPKVRPLSKPYPDMVAQLWQGNPDIQAIADLSSIVTDRKLLDRHLRYVIWFALLGWASNFVEIPWRDGAHDTRKPSPFPLWLSQQFNMRAIWPRFGLYGNVFRVPDEGAAKQSFRSTSVAVNFDPPWTWPAGPPMELFHSPPPAWYDPWGYNRPGDFVTDQPSPTYLDPFCFDGQLKLPQRPVTLDGSFKGRSWAVFVDKDPAEPNTLIVLTDEERQRTTFQLLPPKPLRLTFDAGNHTFQQEVTTLGSNSKLVIGPPAVGFNLARTIQTAWCVVSPDSVSARLRRLVTYDSKTSGVPWDKFVEANKARYGPSGAGKTWKIEICPLPDAALPEVVLDGYVL